MEAYWQHREAHALEQLRGSESERAKVLYADLVAHYRALASMCARARSPVLDQGWKIAG